MIHGYRMNIALLVAALALGAGLSGCGGGGSSGVAGPGGASGPMSARVDGTQWNADELGGGLGAGHPVLGMYTIPGRRTSGGTPEFLDLTLYNVAGPGTYTLGVNSTTFGGIATFGNANASWSTPLSGMSGTAVVTTLTATRIAGTFAFQATPLLGTASGTRNVTEGTFDYPIIASGVTGPLPDNAGSFVHAGVDGSAWNGATIAALHNTTGTPSLIVGASTVSAQLNLTISGFAGPGTYPIAFSPYCLVTWNELGTGHAWGGSGSIVGSNYVSNDSGSVVITSLTSTRVRGTFSGKLAPAPSNAATGWKYVLNGEFDCGLPAPPAAGAARAAASSIASSRR